VPDPVDDLRLEISQGERRATEVVADQLARLRAVAAVTNCVAGWNDDAAMQAAEVLDRRLADAGPIGPLHGIPITVKDWIDVAGLPCTGGFVECRDRVPDRDATAVARLRDAGAIVIAKTVAQVDGPVFGPVVHPADATRSPGGSSSGEAAAVGGSGSILGLGSDSGGSIRLPAAWCGVAALKPSAQRVPTTGHFPRVGDRVDGRTQIGPMARSVRTLAAVLEVIAGPDGVDAGVAPVPLGDPAAVEIAGLRVGWSVGEPAWAPDAAIRAAVVEGVAALVQRGAHDAGEISLRLDESLDVTQRYWQRAFGALDASDTERQLADWDRYRTRMLRATKDIDVVVMPATRTPAPLHRAMDNLDFIYTLPASLTGAPAVVVPVGAVDALPIAVQVVAPPWRDDVAVRVAMALEDALA
jgi:amidase